jgi:plastocyanin
MKAGQRIVSRSRFLVLALVTMAVGAGFVSAAPTVQPATELASPEAFASPVASPVPLLVEVAIDRLRFRPTRVEVSTGTIVRWTNGVNLPHTVTIRGDFDSGRLGKGGTYEHTFSEPGNYWYECRYHQEMVGVIVVRDAER